MSHSAPPAKRIPTAVKATYRSASTASGLLLAAAAIDVSAGAPVTRIGWPLELSAALLFFAAMTRRGRQWGRVMLAILVANTVTFTAPGLLGGTERQALAVATDAAAVAAMICAAATAFLPSANTYVRTAREQARHVSRRLRKALLATHVTSSVGWMGIVTVMATMAIAAAGSDDREEVRAAYTMMLLVDETFLGPAHQLALLSGVALAAGTPWGLWRRRWVAAKLCLMLAIMFHGSIVLQGLLLQADAMLIAGHPVAEIRAEAGLILALLTPAGPMVGLAATLLSIYKPGGPTRYGRHAATPLGPRPRRVPSSRSPATS